MSTRENTLQLPSETLRGLTTACRPFCVNEAGPNDGSEFKLQNGPYINSKAKRQGECYLSNQFRATHKISQPSTVDSQTWDAKKTSLALPFMCRSPSAASSYSITANERYFSQEAWKCSIMVP